MAGAPATIIHIPTPGDHYSSATGSAVMTVIYELSRWHDRAGGATRLIVGKGTRHDYEIGECTEVPFPPLPDRNHKIADALMGRIGMQRRFLCEVYRPGIAAVAADYDGPVVAHNAPVAMRDLKQKLPRARVAHYCHNTLFNTYSDSETRRTLAPADLIICVSQFLAGDLTRRLGRTDGRVKAIINGVDVERFTPNETRPENDAPLILFVGRVSPDKGPDLLMKAAVKLANGKRKFKLRIVGSSGFNAADPLTEYERELRTTAAQISEYVEFVPFVDRKRVVDQYHQADIFCAPSNCDEGCPLTVPEAMACGLPAVVSRRGGIPEEGLDALLYFDTPDTDRLAEHLENLIDNPAARSEWGKKARARAEQISWEAQYRLVRAALFD